MVRVLSLLFALALLGLAICKEVSFESLTGRAKGHSHSSKSISSLRPLPRIRHEDYERAVSYLLSLYPRAMDGTSMDAATLERIKAENPSPYKADPSRTGYHDYPQSIRPKCSSTDQKKNLCKTFLGTFSSVPPVPASDRYLSEKKYKLKTSRWGRDGSNCPDERWLEVYNRLEAIEALLQV